MRRAIYERVGEYDATFRIAGDYELCLRAFRRSAVQFHGSDVPLAEDS